MTALELRRRARLIALAAIAKAARDDEAIESEFVAKMAGLTEFEQEQLALEVDRELRAIADELAEQWGATR